MSSDVKYFTVSSSGYFVGTVALLNSLRLTGNDGELVVVDGGLSAEQRERLAPFCTVLEVPEAERVHPTLLKAVGYRLPHRGPVVFVDSDMIVTRPFDELIAHAQAGLICATPDSGKGSVRWFPEWAELFGLSGELRRQTYVCAGLVAFATERWPDLMRRWWEACNRVPLERMWGAQRAVDPRMSRYEPLFFADQDAFNALLMSEIPADALHVLHEPTAMVTGSNNGLKRTHVRDLRTLACELDGQPVLLLHHTWRPKPWQRHGWRRVFDDAYERLLPRVILADDLPLRLSRDEVPIWARSGIAAQATRRSLTAGAQLGRAGLRHTPRRLATPLRRSLKGDERRSA